MAVPLRNLPRLRSLALMEKHVVSKFALCLANMSNLPTEPTSQLSQQLLLDEGTVGANTWQPHVSTAGHDRRENFLFRRVLLSPKDERDDGQCHQQRILGGSGELKPNKHWL